MLGYLEAARDMGRDYDTSDPDATARALTVAAYGFYEMPRNPAAVSEEVFWTRHAAAADVVYRATFRDV